MSRYMGSVSQDGVRSDGGNITIVVVHLVV